MSISFVGSASNSVASASSLTINYSSTQGNTLILFTTSNGQSAISVTDTAGNTGWRLMHSVAYGSDIESTLWMCMNATAVTSVTVHMTTACEIDAAVGEYSGVLSFAGPANAPIYAGDPYYTTATGNNSLAGISINVQAGNWIVGGVALIPGGTWTGTTGTQRQFVSGSNYEIWFFDNTSATSANVKFGLTNTTSLGHLDALAVEISSTPAAIGVSMTTGLNNPTSTEGDANTSLTGVSATTTENNPRGLSHTGMFARRKVSI